MRVHETVKTHNWRPLNASSRHNGREFAAQWVHMTLPPYTLAMTHWTHVRATVRTQVRDIKDASLWTWLCLSRVWRGPIRCKFVTHRTQVRDIVRTHDSTSLQSVQDPCDVSSLHTWHEFVTQWRYMTLPRLSVVRTHRTRVRDKKRTHRSACLQCGKDPP